MIRRQVRLDSVPHLAADRELLRAELLQHGTRLPLASCLVRVIHELATNGAVHGQASLIEVELQSPDQVWVRIPGEAFDSCSASSREDASGLADAQLLLREAGWEWTWSWEELDALSTPPVDGSSVAPSSSPRRCNVVHLWLRG